MKALKKILLGLLIAVLAIRAPELHYNFIRSQTLQTVVKVTNKEGNSGGTGVHIKAPSGQVYVLTNAHVCEVGKGGDVFIQDDFGRSIPRRVLEKSDFSDLCLVEALPNYKDYISIGSEPNPGQIVAVVGHPALMPTTMTRGEIIGLDTVNVFDHIMNPLDKKDKCDLPKNKIIEVETIFGDLKVCAISIEANLSSVPIMPGNSGSPVVDFYGRLVGLVFAGNRAGWGVFITLKDVNKFLEQY